MATVGYETRIRLGGTSTTLTDAPTTATSGNLIYTITNTANRILDPNVAVVVEEGGVAVTDPFTVDYLFGIITFTTARTGAITVSGAYIPNTVTVPGVTSHTLNLSSDVLDETDYEEAQTNGAYRTKVNGLKDVSISFERNDGLDNLFKTRLQNKTRILVELLIGGTSAVRGWFKLGSTNSSGDLGSLETESIDLQLDGDPQVAFSWR